MASKSEIARRAQAEIEIRRRLEREEFSFLWDWYGDECGCRHHDGRCPRHPGQDCGCAKRLGECHDHPRARPGQRPPGSYRSSSVELDWRIWMIRGGRGYGKMLALDTPIPTPDGWTTMGEIAVGDTVFDEAGKQCRVTVVYEVETPDVCYRVNFSDGTWVDACEDHEWVTWTHAERKAYLRSPYEADTGSFPAIWPKWRLKKIIGNSEIGQEEIESILALSRSGMSARKIQKATGRDRQSIAKHIRAGKWVHREPASDERSPGPQKRTTRQIAETISYGKRGDRNHCIPQCGPLECFAGHPLPIPPYTFGVWLGDGNSESGSATASVEDQVYVRREIESDGFVTSDYKAETHYGILGIVGTLRIMGVLNCKHVPGYYMRRPASERLSLLQGLMDTDGGCENASTVSFTNTNEKLADSVYELVVSLGMRATRDSRPAMLNGAQHGTAYRVTFTPTMPVFRIPRKADRLRMDCGQRLRRCHRMIESVERIESVPMRCISVDSPNRMYLCGKGMIPTHNSLAAARYINSRVQDGTVQWVALIGATVGDVREFQIEHPYSGLLKTSPPWFKARYIPSKARVEWPNGAYATIFTAEEPEGLRGGGFNLAWADELAKWQHKQQYTWDMLEFTLRELTEPRPQVVVTTTPRPTPTYFQVRDGRKTVVTGGTIYENACNLDPDYIDDMRRKYEGTHLGRTELLAEDDIAVPGALWNRQEMIDPYRVRAVPEFMTMNRVVVGVDPNAGAGDLESGAECGIVAGCRASDDRGYTLGDFSCNGSPETWGKAALTAYKSLQADLIVVEKNNGGEMVEHVLRSIRATPDDPWADGRHVNIKTVWASRGKAVRAEPVSALYEQGRISHVGEYSALELQMCSFIPGDPPETKLDRMDALVWMYTELFLEGGYESGFIAVGGNRNLGAAQPRAAFVHMRR